MIFATTGTQLPFDRFLQMLDEAAPSFDGEELIVQARADGYMPKNFTARSFISPDEFGPIFDRARLIIAHAGMGTIISALQARKPIIIVPRMASLGEHRNDHQAATARQLSRLGYINIAENSSDISALAANPNLAPLASISPSASESLIDAILQIGG